MTFRQAQCVGNCYELGQSVPLIATAWFRQSGISFRDSADEKIIVGLELGLRRLAETIAYNSDREKRGAIRFQRFVEGPQIRTDDLPEFGTSFMNCCLA